MIEARALPMGEAAVLIEVEDLASAVALHAALADRMRGADGPWEHVADVVPAARTVLIYHASTSTDSTIDLAALGRTAVEVAAQLPVPDDIEDVRIEGSTEPVEILVSYDGEDLAEVADATGLSTAEVIEAHTGTDWTVAFFGFAPGFAYLAGGDPRLKVSRRSEPRTKVPTGAVGLAGEFSAVYPRESPGGWQLLGHTDEVMWDVDREPPSLLQPGSRIRFVQRDAG